jgi:hypothetical protein
MNPHSPVLKALTRLFARTQAGRKGEGSIDFQPVLKLVLREADCEDGDERAQALHDLEDAEACGLVRLERHRHDRDMILKVRVSLANEELLFGRVGEASPSQRRQSLASVFETAAQADVPAKWRAAWIAFCSRMKWAALSGDALAPFDRENVAANIELLSLLPKLLAWNGESLVRFSSCILCGDSKRLEELASMEKEGESRGKLRGKLGRLLEDITGGVVRSLDDLGIVPNPRSVLLHGPLRLLLNGKWMDLSRLQGAIRLAQSDIQRAEQVVTAATRCLTVENETSFHELAKLQSGELLVQTSYPGSGALSLIRRLPEDLEFWHFGDSDDAGFDILRVLCEMSGRAIRPLHMQRGRIPFEQESLGHPTEDKWPYYTLPT